MGHSARYETELVIQDIEARMEVMLWQVHLLSVPGADALVDELKDLCERLRGVMADMRGAAGER